jgi:phosphonoacetate hydrolase
MELAGRRYAIPRWLDRVPLVVICIDGCDPAYLRHATGGKMFPAAARKLVANQSSTTRSDSGARVSPAGKVLLDGFTWLNALCVIPSFTNANNVSIVTGCPPAVHGVSGNHYYDQAVGKERPMNEAADIRPLAYMQLSSAQHNSPRQQPELYAGTILSALQDCTDRRVRVGAITSKNKLFNLLQRGFDAKPPSAQPTGSNNEKEGASRPPFFVSVEQLNVNMYSKEATLRLLVEGLQMMTKNVVDGAPSTSARPHVLYLSSTDYMQHKYGPNEPEMEEFMNELFVLVEQLRKVAMVCITADHGMSAKPHVVFMSDALAARGIPRDSFRVVLPITDPYVAHHAALGSYCTVSAVAKDGKQKSGSEDDPQIQDLLLAIRAVPGVRLALPRSEASILLSVPNDATVGDIVVIMDEPYAVGKSAADHDLTQLQGVPLRSHGGLSEQHVPLLIDNRLDIREPLADLRSQRGGGELRNFDIFFLALNAKVAASRL